LIAAADALKAVKYGDPGVECSPHEEVGFLMLAKIFHCFVVDHSKK
jgi:hypothetical protein